MGYETINVTPVTPRIGAEVDGLTLAKPLSKPPGRGVRNNRPRSYSHPSHGRARTDDLQFPGVRRNGRSDVLWTKLPGPMEARRRDCR